jgi:adenosylcobinamide hydrolase
VTADGDAPGSDDAPAGVFETTVRAGVCRCRRPGTRWLSTGPAGGPSTAPAAYNVAVPEGWPETDLAAYARERRREAGFDEPGPAGPTLFTGVDLRHARRARLDPVEAVVTAGVSNPAALPVDDRDADPPDTTAERGHGCDDDRAEGPGPDRGPGPDPGPGPGPGTVNVVVGTTRALAPGALANLVAVAAEAKAATLLARVDVPGTTTDAIVAGSDPDGEPAAYSGSATPVGRAARLCVRDALGASLDSRYAEADIPTSVDDAEYGVAPSGRAVVTEVSR